MTLFREFFAFELRFRLKSLSTYVYFLLWTLFSFLCVASESFGPIGSDNGKVLLNGPFANTTNDFAACLFGVIVIAAIFGTTALRDFQRDTYQMLFTKPLSKGGYLFGRFAACLLVTIGVFSGLMLGTFLGTLAPWADHARIAPNHLWWYLQPFLSIVVVQVFVQGAIFYAIGALSRRIVVVYLQGVALFMVYLVGLTAFSATRSLEHFWSGVLDPVGLSLLRALTRYWTVAEKNSLLLPWDFSGYSPGVFLYNRLLWLALAALALGALWRWFPMSVEALTARAQGRRAALATRDAPVSAARPASSLYAVALPRVHQVFGARASLARYLSLTRLSIRAITRDVPFWAITGLLIVFAINNGYFAGRFEGTNVWPVTFLMVQAVEGSATLFFLIVAGLYAAELVWRERDSRFDGIHDALPVDESVDWLAKLTAIAFVELALLVVTMLVGMLMQTLAGYYHYDVVQYLEELFVITFPQMMGAAMLALFVQTMVSNKFVGHAIVIGVFVLQPILFNFGLENTLYLPGAVPAYTYSDMNGYGHFASAIFWSITYWTAIFAFLGVVSIAYARRGTDTSLRARTRLALARARGLAPAALVLAAVAIGSGSWFYYNAHVLNEYLTAADRRHRQAEYERNFKQYENLPQPNVTAVDEVIDIDPATRSFHGRSRVTLQNKTGVPIRELHLTDARQALRKIDFDRPARLARRSPYGDYLIYTFAEPLAPGAVLVMNYETAHESHGFTDGNEIAQFAGNGTFFDMEFAPGVGYRLEGELDDPRRRREEHLPELADLPPRGDPVYSKVNQFSPHSDWITYHAIVSTTDDQVAVAPGYLKREWRKDGRRYFEYDMGGTHIQDFYAYLSGRYQVRRETVAAAEGPVSLEVYYDRAHPFNVDTMLAASRDGLAYFGANFSPYQFRQYRIFEFPRYRSFAQSFPNTIPFAEGIGFITRLKKPTDVDLTYFVTAHELAHQWWGHQLVGGRVQGATMLDETLAQYSAYMLMEQRHGKEYMHRVLHHFLDRYLRGRSGEVRRERPLALVQREPYVWYQKGGQVMYTIADYVGADKVNGALHDFLMQYRYVNADNQVDAVGRTEGEAATDGVYPDTRQFVAALMAVTPPEYQYLVDDGFNRIVLYDNKTLAATSHRLADGRWQVTLDVEAHKVQVDDAGAEHPMPLADYIEIGVFSGAKDEEKSLYLKREKMTDGRHTYTAIVAERPTRAGIDPYNKLIDRIADDNMIDVTER